MYIAGVRFSTGLRLKVKAFVLHEAKSVVLPLEGFTKLLSLRLPSVPSSGLNFCKQRLRYSLHIFFSLQN